MLTYIVMTIWIVLFIRSFPGCAPSYLIYDAAHRLVFSQDGCQRNDSLWSFFVYDVYGRVVVEGECSNSDKHVRTAGETVVLGILWKATPAWRTVVIRVLLIWLILVYMW